MNDLAGYYTWMGSVSCLGYSMEWGGCYWMTAGFVECEDEKSAYENNTTSITWKTALGRIYITAEFILGNIDVGGIL